MTFRTIPAYDGYEINRDGIVQDVKKKRIHHVTISAPHDVQHVGVELFGQNRPCWDLIALAYHTGVEMHSPMLLPRDGNFLNLKEDNLFPFEVSTNCRIRCASDIHGVWRAAMVEQVPCNRMAERLNLPQYGAHEFRVLIGEILLAGIR